MNAAALHQNALIIDGHCDFLYESLRTGRHLADPTDDHISLAKLQQGGQTAQFFAIFDHWAELPSPEQATIYSLQAIDHFYTELETHPRALLPATAAAHIEQAKAEGKIAAILSLEGAEPLAEDLALLRVFYRLGVRNIGLVWNYRNRVADGLGVENPGGLTDFGRRLVAEMDRLGIIIDIAHLAPPGVDDVFRLAGRPVIASHANAQAVCPAKRNLTDRQLDQLARNGGVIGVTFVPEFIAADPAQAGLEKLAEHINHIKQRIGVQHIGLGSDFDGYTKVTRGLEDAAKLPALTQTLVEHGYTAPEINAILGLNFLRVFKEIAG